MNKYIVIGNPIIHSLSPEIHMQFAMQTRRNLHYGRLYVQESDFVDMLYKFFKCGGNGANITLPFKSKAYILSHKLTLRARLARAVNTLKFEHETIFGDNTDGVGLVSDIMRNLNISLASKRILLLGAGGAANGVLSSILEQNPSELVICNRSQSTALRLTSRFSSYTNLKVCEYQNLDCTYDIVINATSASLSNIMPPILPDVFSKVSLAYDMMYSKHPTCFMQYASRYGAIMVRDGLGMLVEQAAEAFFFWYGIRPKTHNVFAMLRSKFC